MFWSLVIKANNDITSVVFILSLVAIVQLYDCFLLKMMIVGNSNSLISSNLSTCLPSTCQLVHYQLVNLFTINLSTCLPSTCLLYSQSSCLKDSLFSIVNLLEFLFCSLPYVVSQGCHTVGVML